MANNCPNCGKELKENASLCECGYRSDEKPKTDNKKPIVSGNAAGSGKVNKTGLIVVAVVLALVIAAVFIINGVAKNTPESTLRHAVECRLSGNVDGLASIDYVSNFSKNESKDDALTRMKGNAELKKSVDDAIKLRIKTERVLIDDEKKDKTELTDRIKALSASYNDTDKITDIRAFTYDLVEKDTVKMSASAEAIKVDGKWYILGVAQTALSLSN